MNHKKYLLLLACFSFVSMMLVASSAMAQPKACVELKAGAGYMAQMWVEVGPYKSNLSSMFTIGNSGCQTIKDIIPASERYPSGLPINVYLKVAAGSAKVACKPDYVRYSPERSDNLIYIATGTTFLEKCGQ